MGETDVSLRIGPIVIEIGRWVYGTVIVMTTLVIYANSGPVGYGPSAGVVVAPMVATFLAHLFADVLAAVNRASSGLRRDEFAALVASDAQYLLLTVPPLAVLAVGAAGAFNAPTAISLIVDGGVALLVIVGALAGHRAGLGWSGIAGCAMVSGALGLLVLAAQLLLKL